MRYKIRYILLALLIFVIFYSCVAVYHTKKPLPDGISMEGPIHYVTDKDIRFLSDLTYKGQGQGEQLMEQTIFEHVFQAIKEAKQFIVIDMFLYNGFYKKGQSFPPLSSTLTEALIAKKREYPELSIVVITDDINTSYGSHPSPDLVRLRASGIETLVTDVDPLRDSNPLYSAGWRIFAKWFGQSGKGWLTNLLANSAPDMTMRSYLKALNAKANHRKVVVTDQTMLVFSGNAHDASFYHSNSGFQVNGNIIRDALESEQAAIDLSEALTLPEYSRAEQERGDIEVRLLTEGKIMKHVLKNLSDTEAGDTIWMGMFYLADREVIAKLLEASTRGVHIQLILDPNENAFGNKKFGIPNRPVASELLKKSDNRINIRWYNIGQEEYHTKLMLIQHKKRAIIHNGSTNFTTRNLDDLNLETNLWVNAPEESKVAKDVQQYFDRLWGNKDAVFTLGYDAYRDKTIFLKRILYRLQSWLDFTTF
ncbi:phosphatidylserine/phosphatidylglycerophosphate/cardiolipin synthase-like enzyme [Paenibacillus castaneae]|uniref:phospholipase D family protein n=1 Tax=Paenibacillus castaneae TaxID=474957 RepID=UPI000C9BC803|nr:phospholipase D family protein [Paenibacillus castaneae]NIK79151.1 phosphatidylserine/phosphatidylglycerophosphate/cardiolipin synthase-like enzyme [Paenibacillus castaneae]